MEFSGKEFKSQKVEMCRRSARGPADQLSLEISDLPIRGDDDDQFVRRRPMQHLPERRSKLVDGCGMISCQKNRHRNRSRVGGQSKSLPRTSREACPRKRAKFLIRMIFNRSDESLRSFASGDVSDFFKEQYHKNKLENQERATLSMQGVEEQIALASRREMPYLEHAINSTRFCPARVCSTLKGWRSHALTSQLQM